MSTKTRTRTTKDKSPEQRQAEAEALHQRLVDQVEHLTTEAGWLQFLKAAKAFHAYSLNNVLLIVAQRPDASQVAGFRQWQARGRQVRKGEKGIKIYGFRKSVVVDEETEEERTVQRFPILTVFDVAQTDPIPDAVQETRPQLLTGDDPHGITDAVTAWLADRGWTLTRESAGTANGYTTTDGTRRVVVDHRLEDAAAAKTALHEAAHVILHTDDAPGEYVAHRGLKETEAESTAYVSAGLLGLDTSAYSVGYIAQWAGGDLHLIRSTATNVLSAVATLAGAFTTEDADQEQ